MCGAKIKSPNSSNHWASKNINLILVRDVHQRPSIAVDLSEKLLAHTLVLSYEHNVRPEIRFTYSRRKKVATEV